MHILNVTHPIVHQDFWDLLKHLKMVSRHYGPNVRLLYYFSWTYSLARLDLIQEWERVRFALHTNNLRNQDD